MLNYINVDSHIEIKVKDTNKLIGKYVLDIDGFYYFVNMCTPDSYWDYSTLSEITKKLKELNQKWADHIETNLNVNLKYNI